MIFNLVPVFLRSNYENKLEMLLFKFLDTQAELFFKKYLRNKVQSVSLFFDDLKC